MVDIPNYLKGVINQRSHHWGGHHLVIVYPYDFIDASIPISKIDPLVAGAQRIPSAVKKNPIGCVPEKLAPFPFRNHYPLVNVYINMENHHFLYVNQLIINAHF